jgi:6-phospho-beta-glucosidase
MTRIKVVILGGSAIATPELVNAIRRIPDRTQPLELVLVSRHLEKLAKVAHIAGLLAEADPLLSVSHTVDLEAAFTGAAYVINQIRVGGLAARAFDESFPQELGLPGEETVGAGGFANTYRTIPVVLEYARLMERLCPAAMMLNFANPSSLLHYALSRYSAISTIGLCNGPVMVAENIAQALDAPVHELVVDYIGMHHFGWVTAVWRRGCNLLPKLLEQPAEVSWGVEPALVQAIGALPGPYLNYVFHPDRILAKKKGQRPRAEELIELQDEILAAYETSAGSGEQWPAALARRKARWYTDIVAPVLLALVEQDQAQGSRFVLNVANGQAVPWLPPQAIVELPTLLQNGQIRPLAAGPAPPDVKALLQANCTYEMLAVEAIVERDRAKALRALLVNPMIHTYDQAVGVLERVWDK